MVIRSIATAFLLFSTACASPRAKVEPAADEPPPVLKFRTELGGGDMNWAQLGAYAPDGKTVYAAASGPNTGLVYVIDPIAGQKLATLKAEALADVDRRYPSDLAISPDGKLLAVAYQLMDKNAGAGVKEAGWELLLWDVATQKVVTKKRGPRWELKHLTFSADSKLLVANSTGYAKETDWYKSVAHVWTVAKLDETHTFETRGHGFSAMALVREGDADVLRAFHGGPMHLWNLTTGKALEDRVFTNRDRWANGYAAFSPDGKTLAVLSDVSDNNGLRIGAEVSLFDAAKGGKPRAVARGHKRDADRITFTNDSKLVATGSFYGGDTIVWDADNLAITATLATYGQLAFSPDGKMLCVSGTGFWTTAGDHKFTLGRHATQVWSVAVAPKGWTVASSQNAPSVRFWDTNTRKNYLIVPLNPNGRTIRSIAYSADGLTLAAVDGDKVKFINSSSGWVRSTADGHTSAVNAVAFSPDGKRFASASGSVRWIKDMPTQDPGELIIWTFDGETAKPIHTIKAHPNGTFCVAFSPDGKTVATGGGEPSGPEVVAAKGEAATKEAVRIWDVTTGKQVAAFPCDPQHHVSTLAFSPDGKTLAHTGIDGSMIRLVDLGTGKKRADLHSKGGATQAIAFNADGTVLAAVGDAGGLNGPKGLIELWDPVAEKLLVSEVAHEQGVNCLAFSPDGKTLYTGGSDGVLNVWDVNPPKK